MRRRLGAHRQLYSGIGADQFLAFVGDAPLVAHMRASTLPS
jgi:hypothetical protein